MDIPQNTDEQNQMVMTPSTIVTIIFVIVLFVVFVMYFTIRRATLVLVAENIEHLDEATAAPPQSLNIWTNTGKKAGLTQAQEENRIREYKLLENEEYKLCI